MKETQYMDKISQLPTINDVLDEKYGKLGKQSRDNFDTKARAWYYAELLKEKLICNCPLF